MILKHCTACGGLLKQEAETDYKCQDCGDYFWNNPKSAVAIILLDKTKESILFAKRGIEPSKDKYDLPGGFLNYNESVFDAAAREIMEETSLILHSSQLLTSYTHEYVSNISVCDLIVISDDWQGAPEPHDDVAALDWRPFSFLSSNKMAWEYAGLIDTITAWLKRQ